MGKSAVDRIHQSMASDVQDISGDEQLDAQTVFGHWERRIGRRSVRVECYGWVDLWPVAQYLAEIGSQDDLVDATKDIRGWVGMMARLAIERGVIQVEPGIATADGGPPPWDQGIRDAGIVYVPPGRYVTRRQAREQGQVDAEGVGA